MDPILLPPLDRETMIAVACARNEERCRILTEWMHRENVFPEFEVRLKPDGAMGLFRIGTQCGLPSPGHDVPRQRRNAQQLALPAGRRKRGRGTKGQREPDREPD